MNTIKRFFNKESREKVKKYFDYMDNHLVEDLSPCSPEYEKASKMFKLPLATGTITLVGLVVIPLFSPTFLIGLIGITTWFSIMFAVNHKLCALNYDKHFKEGE